MATVEDVKIKVTVDNLQSLDQLRDKTAAAKDRMDQLAAAILGVSFGQFIHGALNAADTISDLSDATGIAISSIVGFQNALNEAGGKARNAERIITGFYQAIENANDGSLKARDAFQKVGVSLNDLKTLSETDLLSKTLDGLSKMEAGSERTATATQLLTKAFRGVDPQAFAESLRSGNFDDLTAAIKRGADQAQALEEKYRTLQLGALNAISPILDLMGKHNFNVETATRLVTVLGIAITAAFGASAIASIVRFNAALGITAGLANLIGASPVGIIAKVVALGATAAAATAAGLALEKLIKANSELEKSGTGTGKLINSTTDAGGDAKRTQELDARQRALIESQKRMAMSAAEIEKNIALGSANDIMAIEIIAAAEIKKAREEIYTKEYLTDQQKAAEFAEKRKEILIKAELETAKKRREMAAKAYSVEQEQRDQDARDIAAYEDKVNESRKQAFEQTRALSQGNDELEKRLKFQQDSVAMGTIDREQGSKLLDIEIARTEAIRQLNLIKELPNDERLEQEKKINAEYDRRIGLINKETEARKANEDNFRLGVEQSTKRLEEAWTPLKQGQMIADSVFNNMSSALDKFVETGKLNFGDLARSIIMDLLKIELKAAAVSVFKAAGGSGLFSGLASLFGFADGGTIPTNDPVLVGERGPELLLGAAGRTVVPNNQLGGQSQPVVHNTYNISAVDAKSVAQLFYENRMTMFGTMEQARKEMPFRSGVFA